MSRTLARTAARIAGLALTRNDSAAHQCFRVKNLYSEEVVHFVEGWNDVAVRLNLGGVRLIVADSLDGIVPYQHVAEKDKTITFYRNNNPEGLVYVETSVQSDEQGLQNMFSLRDSNFLDQSFDKYAFDSGGVAGLIVEEGWRTAGGAATVPSLLLERLLTVIRLVHPDIEPVPVRRYIAFVEAACRRWIDKDTAVDAVQANVMVGEALHVMGAFPDPQWNEGEAEARRRRRLELNMRHADLIEGSTELDADQIAAKVEAARFLGQDGMPLSPTEVDHWRERCKAYGRTPTAQLREQIPYAIFSQLFVKDTTGLRLGDRVHAEILNTSPERVKELDALDAVAGLNARNRHDASRLIDAMPAQGLKPLKDLVSAVTRKSVERLAKPSRQQFFNPAIEIVRMVQRVRTDAGDRRIGRIEIALTSPEAAGCPAHGLFTFLFGETLRSIAENLEGVPGGCQLRLQPELVHPQMVPDLIELRNDEAEDERGEIVWEPLPLRITIKDREGKILEIVEQIEWSSPHLNHLAFLWLLAAAPETPALDKIGTLRIRPPADSEDWLTPIVHREVSLAVLRLDEAHVVSNPTVLLEKLVEIRKDLRSSFASRGLEISRLQTFLDEWRSILRKAREQFVPDGVRSRELDAFLGCDLLGIEDSARRMMLSLHPIRLHWICGYLEQTRKLAEEFLSGSAAFADEEGDFYLDWLEKRTPRESPPIAIGHNGQLLYSRSEIGWCEDFSPLATDSGDVDFDREAVASIANRVVSYLETHPYKRDGLSLLVVLPTSDAMAAELLRRVSVRANKEVRISLHVAAPKSRWEAIARSVELLSDETEHLPDARLFPNRDLAFFEFKAGDDLSRLLGGLKLDIAVVTHVLQEQVLSQQNTESPVERPGSFDPLQHRPLRLEAGGGGGSISLVMLPKYPDPVLESWSTLVVRANRCRPVAPSQPDNTDFVELRVNFQDSARLFKDLHDHCHWVITLERHISREQIESVEAGSPDILSIEDGIGANRLSTLVVSSSAGGDLIRSRLSRKLRRLVTDAGHGGSSASLFAELASGIYESTRRLSPKLALQALGVARVTEEIIGLTVARSLVQLNFPATVTNGLVAWISLDEHTDWFGGHAQVRADMCRITLDRHQDGVLEVDILVLEGKLRQLYDSHGVEQVKRTSEFLQSILGATSEDSARKVDSRMWREQLASAIESLSTEAVAVRAEDGDADVVRGLSLSDLRSGEIRVRSVKGVYSACLWESRGEALELSETDGVAVIKSTSFHLVDLVREKGQSASGDIAVVTPPVDLPMPQNKVSAVVTGPLSIRKTDVLSSPADGAGPGPAPAGLAGAGNGKGLPDQELKHIYQEILGCFDSHRVSVSAVAMEDEPYIEGPASILFKVRPGSGIDPRKLAEKGAALKLVLALEQEQNVSFNIDLGFVTIDVPKKPEQRYFVDAVDTWARWTRPPACLAVPIGEDRFGELVELNFSSANSPHLLVAGTTGSGKSEALNTILFGLVHHYRPDELRLMLVDPKGTELKPFEGSSYLEGDIGWDDADALRLLQQAVEEMQRRYQLFRNASTRSLAEYNAAAATETPLPWWLIVLDEYADLTHDPDSKKSIESELKRLAQKARAAGIHVVIATQKPSAEVISTNLRSNLPAQLALRVKSATESRVVIDEAGAETLNGKGDALFKADGKLRRVQCSRVDPSVWTLVLDGCLDTG